MLKDKSKWTPPTNQMTKKPLQFTYEEFMELKRKFKKMAGSDQHVDKKEFNKSASRFSISSSNGFLERLFNSFDIDQDGQISFQDYCEYMQILKCGSPFHKALISFRLIDIEKKSQVSYEDFKIFLKDYFDSWAFMISPESYKDLERQINLYLAQLFEKLGQQTGECSFGLSYYANNIYGTKEFTNAFSFVSEDVASICFDSDQADPTGWAYYQTLQRIHQVHREMFGEKIVIQMEESMTKDEQIKQLKLKLAKIENCLSVIMKEHQEDYSKYQEKYEPPKSQKKLDIEAILMNIPKGSPQKNLQMAGNMVFVGDEKWKLVLNMMVGIQKSIGSVRESYAMSFEVPNDFRLKNSFELTPQRLGEEESSYRTCKFTDYAPNTFNQIRKDINIKNADYINSIGAARIMKSIILGEINSLSSLISSGKSGSFFYYTADGKYILKTIKDRQFQLLLSILQDYYFYLKENPESLLVRYLGLHKLELQSSFTEDDEAGTFYFVIMENFLNTGGKITEKYDIKGSTLGRKTEGDDPSATLKDLDFMEKKPTGVKLESDIRNKIIQTLRKDAEFLKSNNIIDYSLLITFCKRQASLFEALLGVKHDKQKYKDNGNVKVIETKDNQRLILGVIDILIGYDVRKSVEFHFKKIFSGPGASAVPPEEYASRFIDFVENKVFPQPAPLSH